MQLGVLDVGSNTINLQIMDAHHGAAPTPISSYKRDLKLTEYLEESGEISRVGIDRLIEAVTEVFNESTAYEIDEVLAFATSAIREASNSEAILIEVSTRTGIELQVLSGAEEASFTFLAVRRWMGWSAGNLLVIDIGGGSLELAYGNQETPDVTYSFQLGAGRLTRNYLQGDPFTPKSLNKLREHIDFSLENLSPDLRNINSYSAVGTSKTFRTLRRLQVDYLPEFGEILTLKGLNHLVQKLETMTLKERQNLAGLPASRAGQIVAGALVAQLAMRRLGINQIVTCPWALREGIVLQRMDWLK
jgi:exopolyphosphatase/guanosine-5'-triphosphate,3'-diphosphate pyrophosphatase